MKNEPESSAGFYFALPRLFNLWRGRPHQVSEACVFEAYMGSVGIFGVTYLFAWVLFAGKISGWRMIFAAALLIPAVWVFWLLVLYINALFINFLHGKGLFRQITNRDAQNIYIGVILTAFALHLSILHGWERWIGIFCLLGLGANFLAMIMLVMTRKRS
ncbi:MAG: hypothetical protein QOE73_1382 [Verrucomicrobiota bacterium]|jgi:hypothetical protein